jgi:hypothetical protein
MKFEVNTLVLVHNSKFNMMARKAVSQCEAYM